MRAPVRSKAGAIESKQGGVAACLYSFVLDTNKKINCGLLRFARNDRLQTRHCEPPLGRGQDLLNYDKGAWQPAFDL